VVYNNGNRVESVRVEKEVIGIVILKSMEASNLGCPLGGTLSKGGGVV